MTEVPATPLPVAQVPVTVPPADHAGGQVRATRVGTARDHQLHPLRRPRALVSTALRTKSVWSREIFAELAWPGHAPDDVAQWARSGEPWATVRDDQNPEWLANYAQVLAVQLGDRQEQDTARRMLEAVHLAGPLHWRSTELLAQLRLVARDGAIADLLADPSVRDGARTSLIADRANPWIFPDGDLDQWTSAFNAALHSSALADLVVDPDPMLGWEGPGSPLDRLRAPGLTTVDAPHRVTVLMSCFRPGPELQTAVRSVLEQTWSNLELIIVDDASGPEYAALLAETAARDPRIRLLPKAVNGGTYRARNSALRVATGEFCTTLDSDDYLHPQALELGMRRLLARPKLLATRAQGVRVTPDLELTRPGYLPRMRASGTLLFRRPEVMARIGWFDHTSKGADTEFGLRLRVAFGQVIEDLPESILFLRGGDTLSSGEFSMGWRHGARHAYKSAYRRWHQAIAAGTADPFLDPVAPRAFPEPRRWTKPALPGGHRVQVCFAGDWRRYGGPQRSMMEEIRACLEAGLSVAVMHLEAFRFMTTEDLPLCDPVMDLIVSGAVEWLQPDDRAHVDVLVLRYPPILQYPPHLLRDPVTVGHLLLVANQAPLERDGTDQRYVVRDVTQRARELFGVDPVWVPQGPGIRQVLLEQDPEVNLTTWDDPGLIDVVAWRHRDDRVPGQDGPVVVGRYSRDDRIKFPQTFGELLTAYQFPPDYRVRIMGGTKTVRSLTQAEAAASEPSREIVLPSNWEILEQGAMEVGDFLAGLDFFLYADNTSAHEAFGRVILEAAASGVLTIVHPKHRVVFGDTVDYATPGQAQALIAGYVADPAAYRERVERSRLLVAERFGHAGFAQRIRALTGPAADGGGAGQDMEPVQDMDPVQLSVRPTGDPASPIEVGTDAAVATLSVPLRSQSDGARADQLVVLHAPGDAATSATQDWLRDELTGPVAEGVGWVDLTGAPQAVRAVVMVREGLVRGALRGPAETDGSEKDGIEIDDVAHGTWWTTRWSVRQGPQHLTLPAEDGRPGRLVSQPVQPVD
ncbi:glycosyltransferase [Ornithinimicrobium cryptoxanthini]|uniref:glycosyltransferase n=1 Tax=Ornithinimicrobium cryptoxanthini TaxID=2934161 RepID=UPI002119295A|nr:glycosyltransferase [Ornithinimicrobium cryptoxanthini]